MARVVPLTGSDQLRQLTTDKRLANEIHTTDDQKRVFLEDTLVGPVWHGSVANEATMIALEESSERGCFPGDKCFRTDTGSVWLCVTNRGEDVTDWVNVGDVGATIQIAAAKVSISEAVSIADAEVVVVTFDSEDLDTSTFFSTGQPTRLIAPTAALYGFGVFVRFAPSALGLRRVQVRKNGTEILVSDSRNGVAAGDSGSSSETEIQLVFEDVLAQGDYIEVLVYQDSGSALDLEVAKAWITRRGLVTEPPEPPEPIAIGDILINQIFDAIIEGDTADDIEQDPLINQIFH